MRRAEAGGEEKGGGDEGELTLPSKAVMICGGSAGWSRSERYTPTSLLPTLKV